MIVTKFIVETVVPELVAAKRLVVFLLLSKDVSIHIFGCSKFRSRIHLDFYKIKSLNASKNLVNGRISQEQRA
ncbi:unnamed protein product [Larinioides sclopetarius]|uniref:Uncharacterized protein n=1 Tax=Larinioides sclopetarius TaxID=280406 RepID=A0AAV1ZCA1_9ARAC